MNPDAATSSLHPARRRTCASWIANCVIFHTALDMTAVLRELAAEGWDLTSTALGFLSPYITEPIKRFGEYATDGLTLTSRSRPPHLTPA